MSILITGSSGILGIELKKIFPNALTPSHDELDITKFDLVINYLKNNKINILIHSAALTNVRLCEENKQLAYDVNFTGTKNLIDGLEKTNSKAKFIFISTACVFDGHSGMYDESSIPNPENYYSLTKLHAENIVSQNKNNLIIRTNFVSRKKWPYPRAFMDRFGTYLFSDQVANGIKETIESEQNGVIHIVGEKTLSMFELAKIYTPDIQPMTLDDYVGPKLTIDMTLDTIRWKKYSINS
jgi:dTDP-4-dehydrorhamnose reductase